MASTSTAEDSNRKRQDDLWYNDSIYKLHIPRGDHNCEIIFFHDIQWTGCKEPHVETWMSSTVPQVCWPRVWLPVWYPEARILSARYDAGALKKETTGHMPLHLLAENLRQDILDIYKKGCPVFLVGHGLGGLVIKALIRKVQRERDRLARNGASENEEMVQTSDRFLENVRGILYFAPPFLGTELAELEKKKETSKFADLWRQFTDLWRNSPASGSMLVHVQVLNTESCHLNEWFRIWRSKRSGTRSCKTTVVFAALPTKVHLSGGDWCGHVVEEPAARFDVDTFYSSQTDHFTVCKLRDEMDSSFRKLIELICPVMQEIAKVRVAHGKDGEEGYCTELVDDILSELYTRELETSGRRNGFYINRDDTDKIQKFPELWRKLMDGFKEGGLARTASEDMVMESWQPI